MDIFFKAVGAVMIASILVLILNKHNKDFAMLLSVTVCCGSVVLAVQYIQPVFAFILELQNLGSLNSDFLMILLKTVGISFVAEIAALICEDSGNAALGKAVHYLAVGTVLWLSIPLLSSVIELVSKILGEA